MSSHGGVAALSAVELEPVDLGQDSSTLYTLRLSSITLELSITAVQFRPYIMTSTFILFAHNTYLLHGRLLKELEIFSFFMSILAVVFLGAFIVLCFYSLFRRPCYVFVSFTEP